MQCREKWQNVLDPSLKHNVPWTKEEDALLAAGIAAHGAGKWATIARKLPGRTDEMVKRRWAALAPDASAAHKTRVRETRRALPGNYNRRSRREESCLTRNDFSATVEPPPLPLQQVPSLLPPPPTPTPALLSDPQQQ